MAPPPPALAPVAWSIMHVSVSGVTLPEAQLEIPLHLGVPPPGPQSPRDLCWLDTGAPVSVVPFHVHHQRLAWQAIPGIKPPGPGSRVIWAVFAFG